MHPRDDIDHRLQMAAAQAFRGHKLKYDSGLITGVGHHGQPLADIPSCQPYGLRSNPPQDHELVYLQTAAGLVVVTTRQDATDFANLGLTEPEDGETLLYNSQGVSVHLDKNGDINYAAKTSRKHKFTLAGGTADKSVAYYGKNKDDSSTVAAGTGMETFTQAVVADLATLWGVAGGSGTGPVGGSPTTTELAEGDDHSYVSSGTAKVVVED